jgi:hypothetical protein
MVAQSGHAVADELGSDADVRHSTMIPYGGSGLYSEPHTRRDPQIRRAPNSAGLYDVLDLILDKGIVVDAFVRVSLVGIELLTVDLRVVIASVDTYLRYAEGVERLSIRGDERSEPKSLPNMVGGGMKSHGLKKAAEKVKDTLTGGDDDEEGDDGGGHPGVVGALAKGVRRAVGRVAGALSGDPSEYEDEEHGGGGGGGGGQHAQKDRGRDERHEGGRGQGKGQRHPVKLPGRNR